MVSGNELNIYRTNVIECFFKNILEIDEDEAKQNAIFINQNLSENALVKLVHFFDMINQTTGGHSPQCSNCRGECHKCSENHTES